MSKRVCPWWVGYCLLVPLRRFIQNPYKVLTPFVAPGMTVLDVGPGMGFFSLPLARIVGNGGQVLCVDIQEQMLLVLQHRAAAAHLADRISTRLCTPTSLSLDDCSGRIDFALAFAVVHEVPDQDLFFDDISRALKQGGACLFVEPKGHVTAAEFEHSIAIAAQKGLREAGRYRIRWSHAVLLKKSLG